MDINNEFSKLIKQRIDEKLPLSEWIPKNKIVNEIDVPLEFNRHNFLKAPMDDWTQIQVCMKASQIGWSTLAIVKSLYAAKMLNWQIIYTLPSERKLWDFQSSKTDELIARNAIFKSWVSKNAALQKKVGNRFINYRGAYSEQDAITLTADVLMQDEYDRSNMEILDMYKSRLGISDYKGIWRFSNPSAPRIGVHKYWLQSDMKHWFIKCRSCGTKQFLGWFDAVEETEYAAKIDLDKKIFVCRKCGKLLPEDSRSDGEWVAKKKDRDVSGYWVSQIMAPWIKYQEIFDSFENDESTTFYNFTLGLPTKGERFQITKDLILNKVDFSIGNKFEGNAIGIDVGKILHYVVGNKQGIFEVGTTNDWEYVKFLLNKYKAIAVIDSEPDITMPRKIQEEFKGRVYLANYHRSRTSKEWLKWGTGKEFGVVSAHRSRAIGYMVDYLRNKAIFIAPVEMVYRYAVYEKGDDYVSHLESFYQTKELDRQTGEYYYKWDSGDKDHYGHATIYFLLALMRGGGKVEVSTENFKQSVSDVDKDNFFEKAKEGGHKSLWLEQ